MLVASPLAYKGWKKKGWENSLKPPLDILKASLKRYNTFGKAISEILSFRHIIRYPMAKTFLTIAKI